MQQSGVVKGETLGPSPVCVWPGVDALQTTTTTMMELSYNVSLNTTTMHNKCKQMAPKVMSKNLTNT